MNYSFPSRSAVIAAFLLFLGCISSRANVYATDIKLNGSTNNAAIMATNGLQISYILNEPATTGVTVMVVSNTYVVWSNYVAGGAAGAMAGSNVVWWSGTNQGGVNAAEGIYSITITAATGGHVGWTNITDASSNFQVNVPMSIAVNKNTNSPYLGRVFVGTAPPPDLPGFDPGILKFNADGSGPDEGGGVSTGGYGWAGSYFSPWKISISGDDTVYVDDWNAGGIVLAFDEVISTNYLTVLGTNNYSYASELLSGPWVTGAGSNTLLLMADANTNTLDGPSAGILEWEVTNNGALGSNDTGVTIVGVGSNYIGLTVAPWAMAMDGSGNIYAIQNLDGVVEPAFANTARLFCFPPYQGVTETNATWSAGSTNQNLEKAYGVAVDPTGTFVAVAVFGYGTSAENLTNGAVNIYYATNGELLVRLAATNGLDSAPEYTDVSWDLAGNVYATDFANSLWRVYSPPGPNQATTVAVPVVEVYDSIAQPLLWAPQAGAGQFGFTLVGQSNVSYVIQSSPDLATWTSIATNYDTAAVRFINLPAADSATFYQAVAP